MQKRKEGLRTYGQASRGVPSAGETPDGKRRYLQVAHAQKPKGQPKQADDEKRTEQTPSLSTQQQNHLAAIENYARHFGLEKEGLAFAHAQAGLPPPTEEQKMVAEQGLPVRPKQTEEKTSSHHHGGFYLGEKSP
ncbi:MAG TPA: hypothetical protein VFN35_06185 [Ktedonobacteraceae bacterium]|nr:hypothetical protein [Ktedonobacteraceae bacterium]